MDRTTLGIGRKRVMRRCLRGGQAFAEYVILFGVVAMAVIGMQILAKRAVQGALKAAADDMISSIPNSQGDEWGQTLGMRQESGDTGRDAAGNPLLVPGMPLERESVSVTSAQTSTNVQERTGGGRGVWYRTGSTSTDATSTSKTVHEVKW